MDALQRISEPVLTDCPECGKPALRKLVSAPSFRLKGGGWYETDFKTGNKKNLAGEKEAGAGKKGDKPDAKAKKDGDGKGASASAAASGKGGSGPGGSKTD